MCRALSQVPGYEAPNSAFQTFMVDQRCIVPQEAKSRRDKRVAIKGQTELERKSEAPGISWQINVLLESLQVAPKHSEV